MASGEAPKELLKSFEKIKQLLGQISDKTAKPMDANGFKRTKNDLDKVSEKLHTISRLVGDFSSLGNDAKLSFLKDDEKKKLEEAAKAMERYLELVT
jgi:hypothetical protein